MKKYIYTALMVLYIGLSIATIIYSSKWMDDINFNSIGTKALDIAILTAKNFTITNAEVNELERMDYERLDKHPVNIRLTDMFNDPDGYSDIEYVYIMTKLEDNQIKYRVPPELEGFYQAKAGTPLNLMWLVNVVLRKTHEEIIQEDAANYDDIRRYSYTRPSNENAFTDRKPYYVKADDEYGTVISGLTPIYTEEGTFIGMLGVDISIKEFKETDFSIKLILLSLFLLPSLTLSAVYIVIYINNIRKANMSALTDAMTSAKNRRFLDKNLPQLIKEHYRRKQPLSVIMIDVDHFKAYNDNYGHQQGDVVLIEITKAINSVLRDKMDMICRYGGEEFLVILTQTKSSDAEKVAERIKTAINNRAIKHEYNESFGVVTASQGVYSAVPLNTDTDKTFIGYADKALYEAKESGRNKYVFYGLPE